MRAKVVFPQPLSPTTANVSPRKTEKLTPSTAVHGLRQLDRGEWNLQAELAAKENLARFEQSLPF